MNLSRLEHVAIVVDEAAWEDTLQFYVDVAGLDVIDGKAEDRTMLLRGEQGSAVELIKRTSALPSGPPAHIAFVVETEHWDEITDALRLHAPVVREAEEHANGGVTLLFADPSGNAVQLVKRTRPLIDWAAG